MGVRKQITYSVPFYTPIDRLEDQEEEIRSQIEHQYYITLIQYLLAEGTDGLRLSVGIPIVWTKALILAYEELTPFGACPLCPYVGHGNGTHFKFSDREYTLCRLCHQHLQDKMEASETPITTITGTTVETTTPIITPTTTPTTTVGTTTPTTVPKYLSYCLYRDCNELCNINRFYCPGHDYRI